jgi:putative transposase
MMVPLREKEGTNMKDLQHLIQTTRDAREVKRALAVQNILAGRPRSAVAKELGYSPAWVKKWCWRYRRDGIDGLKVAHKGSTGYLTTHQRTAIITWLQEQPQWDIQALARHIDATYGVRYQSPKSYYAVLHEARMSWKKSQDAQPKADPKKVSEARTRIKKKRTRKPPPSSTNAV